jgi:hypothetical protein
MNALRERGVGFENPISVIMTSKPTRRIRCNKRNRYFFMGLIEPDAKIGF